MRAGCRGIALLAAASSGAALRAQETTRISVAGSGAEGNGASWNAGLSADGRFAVFSSVATNLVGGDTNGVRDVFVRDRFRGTTERVSVDSAGAESDGDSVAVAISDDGTTVAFTSLASNLVAGDANGSWDVFVHDRSTGITERVSVDSAGVESDGESSGSIALSGDGRFVAFASAATNLVPGDSNASYDVFVHDRSTGITERVSVDSVGSQGDDASTSPALSADGVTVAFASIATDLVAGDVNGLSDIFVHDRSSGATTRVSVDASGAEADGASYGPALSGDGGTVVFYSSATDLVANDVNGATDVFLHRRATGTIERVSVDSSGAEADRNSFSPFVSRDGDVVAFHSFATNLVAGDTNLCCDGFLRVVSTGATARISVDSTGVQGDATSVPQAVSADGGFIVIASDATNLVAGDGNLVSDDFLHGPSLTLEESPPVASAGQLLDFEAAIGEPGGATMLVVTDVDGTAMFVAAVFGTFDATGYWTQSPIVPPGLAGTTWTLRCVGIDVTGRAESTNEIVVRFHCSELQNPVFIRS
jgi:hypothetical protein